MTAARGSQVGDPIPALSDEQYRALREFIVRHRDETDGRISINPILLARVVADDKPAADIYLKGDKTHPDFDAPDRYLRSLCETLDLELRTIKGSRDWVVGRSRWRLECLPTVMDPTDAYHRRCGFVYGYPEDAIEEFIETDIDVTNCDLVRAGIFAAEEIAYLTFVPYARRKSLEQYEERIKRGKQTRRRLARFADAWDLPVLDDYATLLYNDVVDSYRGDATWSPLTLFPPGQTVDREDVLALFP